MHIRYLDESPNVRSMSYGAKKHERRYSSFVGNEGYIQVNGWQGIVGRKDVGSDSHFDLQCMRIAIPSSSN